MTRTNLFAAIPLSFFSKPLYREIATSWGGRTFIYLLLIVVLSWIPATIKMQSTLNRKYDANIESVILQVPNMKLQEGKIITPEKKPYLIKNKEGETLAIIDTSGEYRNLENANTNLLVTQNEIFTRPNKDETRSYQIPAQLQWNIVPETVNHFIKDYKSFAWIFFVIFFVITGFIYRVFQSLIYAIFGKIIASSGGISLSYIQVLFICMVAITPALFIATVFDWFGIYFKFQLFFYLLLSLIYIYFGVHANKTTSKT